MPRISKPGDLVVPSGVTLTLEAGVEVRVFALSDDTAGGNDTSRVEIIVENGGSLLATGASGNEVVMGSTEAIPGNGDWYGVRGNGSFAVISLGFTTIRDARYGVYSSGIQSLTVQDCVFENLENNAVRDSGSGSVTVERNNITLTGASQTFVWVSSGMSGSGSWSIQNNTLTSGGDGGTGINLYGDYGSSISADVVGNTLVDRFNTGVYASPSYPFIETPPVSHQRSESGTIQRASEAPFSSIRILRGPRPIHLLKRPQFLTSVPKVARFSVLQKLLSHRFAS
jgi:hypothetical protein